MRDPLATARPIAEDMAATLVFYLLSWAMASKLALRAQAVRAYRAWSSPMAAG